MKWVIFGLTVTSSWANGHATIWRGLCRALAARGHRVIFFERDEPYYARQRDAPSPAGCDVRLYREWRDVRLEAERELADCDVAIVTSYCRDAIAAAALPTRGVRVFYDLDTPVTLSRLDVGLEVDYLPPEGLSSFDVVLSYGGGPALDQLRDRLGARRVVALYGCADSARYQRVDPHERFAADFSYIGTYAPDRQEALERLFFAPARRLPHQRFLLAGSNYPESVVIPDNVRCQWHVAPPDHPSFYSSARLTVSVTRGPMAALGFCPSGRLFEAAACGTPVLTDPWPGIERFFEPGREILVARSSEEAIACMQTPMPELERIGRAARDRVRSQHSAEVRAAELVAAVEGARGG